MNWAQLWEIASTPDNVPIVALLFLVPFYAWYGLRQALANDRLIAQLEADPQLAKTHHRKTYPFRPGWTREVYVWPFLLRVEFLAAIIVTVILMVWSLTLDAPLEEPANPNLTMNPAKAPWYFLGLQEMLVYFDPWIAGVLMPTLIVIGLMVIPYIDENPLGCGYYTFRQRRFAILTFCFGFILLWVAMVIIGTFIRGPGWMWFWPGQIWDHNKLIFETNRDLPDMAGITTLGGWLGQKLSQTQLGQKFAEIFRLPDLVSFAEMAAKTVFGALVVGGYYLLAGAGIHKLVTLTEFNRKIYKRMNLLQYLTLQVFLITMLSLPVKILLRQILRIKYVWVTPWFNV